MTARLTLGTMNFGKRTPRAEALRIVERAIDAGIEWLDTANVYTDGESERIVGQAVRGRVVQVATKVGLARQGRGVEGLSPARILAACDESRARLGLDAIDLYYLHAPDPNTPPEATLAAVGELLTSGKIRAWGVSNFASWQILELRGLAAAMGLPMPAVAQQLYNVLVRQLDVEYFAFARRFPIHTTVYNPLAGGLLAGAHTFGAEPAPGSRFAQNRLYRGRYWRESGFAAVEALREIAAEAGISLLDLAYGFVLAQPGVDSVLVGPGTLAHLEAALSAVPLSADLMARLDTFHAERLGTDARYAR